MGLGLGIGMGIGLGLGLGLELGLGLGLGLGLTGDAVAHAVDEADGVAEHTRAAEQLAQLCGGLRARGGSSWLASGGREG